MIPFTFHVIRPHFLYLSTQLFGPLWDFVLPHTLGLGLFGHACLNFGVCVSYLQKFSMQLQWWRQIVYNLCFLAFIVPIINLES